MKKWIVGAVGAIAALALFGVASATGPGEVTDLNGWTTSIPDGGFIEVVSECLPGEAEGGACPGNFAPYSPYVGQRFVILKTDGPGSFTVLSREFGMNAGETISGAAFLAEDEDPGYCDLAEVIITENGVPTTVFSADACSVEGTPWTPFAYTASSSGIILLEARITNDIDSSVDSLMGLDGVVDESAVFAPSNPNEGHGPVGPGIAGIFTPSQAIAPATGRAPVVTPPSTGTGVTITPPSTGDAGLADRNGFSGLAAGAIVAVVLSAVGLKVKTSRA